MSAPVLVSWRCLLAAAGAGLWVVFVIKRPLWLGGRAVMRLLGVGVLIGLHWLCLFGAVKIANVSIALAGLATLSFFTAFAEPLMSRRRVRGFEVLLGLVVVAGIVLIAGAERGHLLGLVVALMSALLAAVFMVINKHIVVAGGQPMVMVAWEMLAATAVCLVAVPVFGDGGFGGLWFSDPLDWLWLILLAFGCTVFAQAWANHLLGHISAYTFNLAANFEPVYGIIAAALIFGEHQDLKLSFYLGAVIIMLVNVAYPRLQRRFGA